MDLVMDSVGLSGNGVPCRSRDRTTEASDTVLVVFWRRVADFVVECPAPLAEYLARQYHDDPHWTYPLHYDNRQALVKADEQLGPLPSYSTLRRYMVSQGLVRKPRLNPKGRPGELLAARRRERREIRSYEADYVGSLWHLDFHHGSRKVVYHNSRQTRGLKFGCDC